MRWRWPYMSAYATSKHALGRFVEFVAFGAFVISIDEGENT